MTAMNKFVFLLFLPFISTQIDLVNRLHKVTDFGLKHYQEINFDGLLGFVIAEAQTRQSLQFDLDIFTDADLQLFLRKCAEMRRRIIPILPRKPAKMPILAKYLLRPENWLVNETFKENSLENFGIYKNWTQDDILKSKHAFYKGIPSDYCLLEILNENCYMSSFCAEMMLAPRLDTGYLLSHKLFYLQIVRLKGCLYNTVLFTKLTKNVCSLMLRETRTNAYLGFPAHDIALEQMVLCGIEGYSEFLNENWRNKVVEWQTQFGCYESKKKVNLKRSSNVIAYGCSDHTTGLGAAALAINLKYHLYKKFLQFNQLF